MDYQKFVIVCLSLFFVRNYIVELRLQQRVNHVADFALTQFVKQNPDSLPLPNVKINNILIGIGSLEASSGTLYGLRTIRRNSNIKAKAFNRAIYLTGLLAFENLTINYNKYKLEVFILKSEGNLKASAADVRIKARAWMGKQSLCFITLDSIKVMKVGKIEICFLTKYKFCSRFLSVLATSGANLFTGKIKKVIPEIIDSALSNFLKTGSHWLCNNMNESDFDITYTRQDMLYY